jgi:glycine cleavage system transcriptional repressor
MPEIKKYLSIVALGANRDKLAVDLVGAIARRGCAIADCRIAPLGDHFSAALLLAGNWSAMGKMESALPGIAEQLGLAIQFQHTQSSPGQSDYRPYAAEAVAPQQPRLLGEIIHFFTDQNIRVVEVSAQVYDSSLTGAAMCNLHLALQVPNDHHPQTLRDAFMDICDDLHADGLLDPIKN